MPLFPVSRIRPAAFALAAGLMLTLQACTAAPAPVPGGPSPPMGPSPLPSSHVHGLTVDGDTGQVLLATHEGLFDVTKQPATKIGTSNDLMGFTAGQDQGIYYASGHPGPGSDLPNPLGLLRSTDGGKTWEKLSREGESDFHALTTAKSGIVAFDGKLRTSADGKSWKTVDIPFVPAALAGHPASDTLLATTRDGLQRSTDGGATWSLNSAAPVIQFAAFASPGEAVGVEPDGTVHTSSDAGETWTRQGGIEGEVHAIATVKGADGKPWIWAATSDGIVVSTDGGTTFRPADAS
jgi:hypothetical protein